MTAKRQRVQGAHVHTLNIVLDRDYLACYFIIGMVVVKQLDAFSFSPEPAAIGVITFIMLTFDFDAFIFCIGVKTARRWMKPPHKGHDTANKYYGFIGAKIPPKRNDVRVSSEDDHFYAARVRYALEFTAKFPSISRVISVDNKCGIKVGDRTTAVDRHLHINRFYPTQPVDGDTEPGTPRYVDHDFPVPGYILTPGGILEMTPHDPPQVIADDDGRLRYK